MPTDPTAHRLQGYLNHHAAAYAAGGRSVWARLADRHLEGAGTWPEWCWLPLAEVSRVQAEVLRAVGFPDEEMTDEVRFGFTRDLPVLSALAHWRLGRGIYRFDQTLLQALWATPVKGDLPGAVLQRLPEWGVYVEAPMGVTHVGLTLLGFWAHLEYDRRSGGMELRLLPDLRPAPGQRQQPFFPLAVLLGGTVEEGLRRYLSTEMLPAEAVDPVLEGLAGWAEGAVSVLLYLCSLRAEYNGPHTPRRAGAQQVRRSRHVEAATAVWGVGSRLGATLRASGVDRAVTESVGEATGTRRSPKPHLRAPHWTTVWTGPKTETQTPSPRWIPPTLVMAGDPDGPAVVHRVEP